MSTFPKKDRYTLGQKCDKILLDIIEDIITASALTKYEKAPILKKVSIRVDVLKVLLRLAKELKVIDLKKYITLEEYLQEIGKMLGGWIKSLQ